MCAKLLPVVVDSLGPYGLQPARLLCPWHFPSRNIGVGCPPPGYLPYPGIELTTLMSSALVGKSLPLVPHGKPNQSYTQIHFYELRLTPIPSMYVTSLSAKQWKELIIIDFDTVVSLFFSFESSQIVLVYFWYKFELLLLGTFNTYLILLQLSV